MAEKLSYPPQSDNPLFVAIPTYESPTIGRRIKWKAIQVMSTFLYMGGVLVLLGAILRSLIKSPKSIKERPFQEEENRREQARKDDEKAWERREAQSCKGEPDVERDAETNDGFVPTEGGPDKFIVDTAYYAKRVGLDSEEVKVQTEDGHIIVLWHIYDPREYTPMTTEQRAARGPECIDNIRPPTRTSKSASHKKQKYPVLMIHGLLQSAGVYVTNDEHSLAFWLCKLGYDVWLGNNRSGFKPEHVSLKPNDPSMWAWNIRHMGELDLPALIARVLSETGFPQLALVGHSQGTTQTLIALSKDQRPSMGAKISVFCGLAPAVYSGPLLNSKHFKFCRDISPSLFRKFFGIKGFMPILSSFNAIQGIIPQSWIGAPSFIVYNYLFGWGDDKWDRGVRDRNFMFAPTYISAEAMKWWLSREGFAQHGCILSPEEEWRREDEEDALEDYYNKTAESRLTPDEANELLSKHEDNPTLANPWYDSQSPPMAFWVAGNDYLVDGRKLLNRFRRGREPHARVVHANIIEGYEHLDVVWSCDAIEKVGTELRDVIWKTCSWRDTARVPKGCHNLQPWVDDRFLEKPLES
ncbi:Glucosyltransferase-like protein [Clarireedia jacksonii]